MKSDSRVSIRRRRQPAAVPLSIRKGVMSNARGVHRATDDMTGLAAIACEQAMVGPVGPGASPGSHAAQFSKTASRPSGGLPSAQAPFRARPARYRLAAARASLAACFGTQECSRVAVRSSAHGLEHGARWRRLPTWSTAPSSSLGRQVERRPGRPRSPSSLTPPCRISRRASLEESPNSAAISAGRWTVPVAATLEPRHGDLVRELAAHVDLVEALLGRRPRARRRGSGR